MQLFKKASLQRKQTLIIMLTTTVALLLACAAFTAYEVITFRKAMVRNLSTLAEIVGNNTSASLDFNDPKSAAETLSALKAEPNIVAAFIYTKERNVFAAYDRPDDNITVTPPKFQREGYAFGKQRLALFRPIVYKGETIGVVYLESDLQALYSRLARYAAIVAGVFAVTLVVAFFLSARLQRLISGPILHLVETTRAVATDRNYSLRAVKESEDELGVLIDGFNEMLAQIQERDAALQNARGQLEKRVEERTGELANSLSLLQATLESTADGVLVTDAKGNVVSFNDQFIKMWGICDATTILGDRQKLQTVILSQMGAPEAVLAKIQEIQERAEAESFEVLEFKDGRTFERYSKPQWINEQCVGRVWSCRDVTERRRGEVASQAFSKLGQSLVSAVTPEEAARSIADIADELFGWDACAFYLFFQETDRVYPLLYMDTFDGRRMDVLPADEFSRTEPSAIDRRVVKNGAELTLKEGPLTMQEGAVPYGDMSRPSASIMRVPVRAGNRVVGVLNIHSYTLQAYKLRDLTVLQTLADYCGGALERIWAENALRKSESQFRVVWDSSVDGMRLTNNEGVVLQVNDAYCRMVQKSKAELEGQPLSIVYQADLATQILTTYKERVDAKTIEPHSERELTLWNGSKTWLAVSNSLLELPGQPGLLLSILRDVSERKQTEARLEQVHKQLLDTSRQAGMAEVATSVLHNVGNVLNSVNISSSLASDKIRHSKVSLLTNAVSLMQKHADDLPGFLTNDPKGRQLPGFLGSLADHLAGEQKEVLQELTLLAKNIEHIKEIVAMQQSYAKVSGLLELLPVVDLVEDALRMNAGAMERHQVRVIREFAEVPPMLVEKHKVLQILVNLIRNAKYALDDGMPAEKLMTLRVGTNGNGMVRISVIDNGVGIPVENQIRIFGHGFTTRKEGHGFGLHNGALAARELGGSLTVQSEGPGKGSMFTLEFPGKPQEKMI